MSDIACVLRHYGAERVPVGYGWVSMKCPFHDDDQASAQVNNSTNRFRCFGCEVTGDAFQLVMDQDGVRFPEAKRIVAGIIGTGGSDVREERGPRTYLPGFSGSDSRRG